MRQHVRPLSENAGAPGHATRLPHPAHRSKGPSWFFKRLSPLYRPMFLLCFGLLCTEDQDRLESSAWRKHGERKEFYWNVT